MEVGGGERGTSEPPLDPPLGARDPDFRPEH